MTGAPSLPIPAGPEALTAEWITAALRSGGAISDARVATLEVEPIGEGAAFAGEPVRLRLAYDRPEQGAPATLVAKFPAEDPAMRRALSGLRWYEREIRFYEQLAGDSPIRTPRCYYGAMDRDALRYLLLIEEVTWGRVGDQVAGASAAQAQAVVEHVARLHARWWAHPRLDALEWLAAGAVRPAEGAERWAQFYRHAWSVLPSLVTGAAPARALSDVEPIAGRLGDAYAAIVSASAEPPRTLIHGDCRLDNVLFADDPDEPPTFIDWQMVSRGRGVYDIAYFLGTNLEPELRRTHERELLRRYHAIVSERDESGYDLERCLRDYRLAMLLVFGFWVQTAGAATFPAAAHPLRDAAIERAATALLDLDAGELLADFGA